MALRQRAIKFVTVEGGSWQDASRVLGIHINTLAKWLKKYRETGSVSPEKRITYRKRKVDINALKQMLDERPDATLEELAAPFDVYPSTIDYHLRKHNITRKKNHAPARARRRKKA